MDRKNNRVKKRAKKIGLLRHYKRIKGESKILYKLRIKGNDEIFGGFDEKRQRVKVR